MVYVLDVEVVWCCFYCGVYCVGEGEYVGGWVVVDEVVDYV